MPAPAPRSTRSSATIRHDGEAYAWRAEAALRAGDAQQARADAQRSSIESGDSFAATAIHLLADLHSGRTRGWPLRLQRAPGIVEHARRELSAELTALCAEAPAILAHSNAGRLAALLEHALAALRGNRTALATWVRGEAPSLCCRGRHPPASPRATRWS